MLRQARALAVFTAVAAALLAPSATRAGMITQTANLPLTPTDFGPSSSKVAPLVFQQFDTLNGNRLLDSVVLSFHALIKNEYGIEFTTPATITVSVATGKTDTPGPAITIYQPDAQHPLLTVKAPNDPSFLTRSVTYGYNAGETLGLQNGQLYRRDFASSLPSSSPYYLAPSSVQASNNLNMTAAADLALFTGKGNIRLPVSASACSMFRTTAGNGCGAVTTEATADATLTYNWHDRVPIPEVIPEPAAVLLWGIGGSVLAVAHLARRRRA